MNFTGEEQSQVLQSSIFFPVCVIARLTVEQWMLKYSAIPFIVQSPIK